MKCRLCGKREGLIGTDLCVPCWELESRIGRNPKLARKILNRDQMPTWKKIILIIVGVAAYTIVMFVSTNNSYNQGKADGIQAGKKAVWCAYLKYQFKDFGGFKREDCDE